MHAVFLSWSCSGGEESEDGRGARPRLGDMQRDFGLLAAELEREYGVERVLPGRAALRAAKRVDLEKARRVGLLAAAAACVTAMALAVWLYGGGRASMKGHLAPLLHDFAKGVAAVRRRRRHCNACARPCGVRVLAWHGLCSPEPHVAARGVGLWLCTSASVSSLSWCRSHPCTACCGAPAMAQDRGMHLAGRRPLPCTAALPRSRSS